MSDSSWSDVSTLTTKIMYAPTNEEAVLISSELGNSMYFGSRLAMDNNGDRLVISDIYATVNGVINSGKVYIFIRSGTSWTIEQVLQSVPVENQECFGVSTAISGDSTRIAIKKQYTGTASLIDKIYIYLRSGSTWTLEETLYSGEINDVNAPFGRHLCLNEFGDRIFISHSEATVNSNTNAGKVHVYSRTGITWTKETEIISNIPTTNEYFGSGISSDYSGTRVFIGMLYQVPGDGFNSGGVSVFVRSGTTWSHETILYGSNRADGDAFGMSGANPNCSTDSDGTRVAILATMADIPGFNNVGKIYIFVRSGTSWTQEAVLTASDYIANMRLGRHGGLRLSNDGSKLIISRSFNATNNKIYFFTRSGTNWYEIGAIMPSDFVTGDTFSSPIVSDAAITRVVGASINADFSGYTDAGKVYIFS